MKKDLQIYDELSDVITALTNPIEINSISELDGFSTINTTSVTIFDNLSEVIVLTDGMIVTIDSINYPVVNVVNTPLIKSFRIEVLDLPETEWNVAANFQTGSRNEINEILDSKNGNENRFPLIWLLPETDLDGNHPVLDFTVTLNLVFAYKANNTDRTGKRIINNFKPVIQPLQTLFNKWLQSSDFNYMLEFFGYGKPIDNQYSNLPFFGNEAKTAGVLTTTHTDAKQIEYNLNFKKQYFDIVIDVIPFPNPNDLNTWHKTITGVDFAENINNFDAKFLPRVADFKGIDDAVVFNSVMNLSISTYCFNLIINDFANFAHIIGTNDTGLSYVRMETSKQIRIETTIDGDSKLFGYIFSDNVEYKIIITVDALANWSLYVNDDFKQTISLISSNLNVDRISNSAPSRNLNAKIINFSIFERILTTQEITDYSNNIIPDTPLFSLNPTGQGNYEYDLVNNNHGTWSGTGTRFDYDENGSIYPNANGYSLWQLAANPDIQVPFDINGLPLVLTPGVDIPVGYTHSYDLSPAGDKHNIYDSLINFNPDGLLDAELEIYNRSNTDIQAPPSRASIYYDATDRTTSSIYHISEIVDPRIYDTFFNPDYKNIIFGKIIMDGINIVRYAEELNYKTQREGVTLTENEVYCGFITNIYP